MQNIWKILNPFIRNKNLIPCSSPVALKVAKLWGHEFLLAEIVGHFPTTADISSVKSQKGINQYSTMLC